jgi:hypothetical protein
MQPRAATLNDTVQMSGGDSDHFTISRLYTIQEGD